MNLSAQKAKESSERLSRRAKITAAAIERVKDKNEDSESESDFDEVMNMFVEEGTTNTDCGVISPDNIYRSIWDMLLMLFLFMQAITIPLRVAFNLPTTGFTFYSEMVIDIMFMVDIPMNFNTGFYDKGLRIMKRSLICYDYL
jgi:hypothetical protein